MVMMTGTVVRDRCTIRSTYATASELGENSTHCLSVLSPQIGWEGRLRNDLFCVEWDVKP